MLGKLRGKVEEISNDQIILDVNGVGYLVQASLRTIQALSKNDNEVTLYVNMQVREDNISLYGFLDEHEKEWFLKLISVKGVGPRLALAILSSLTPAQISSAIFIKDVSAFNKISGVGKKIAERLVTELKDKSSQQTSSLKLGASEPGQTSSDISEDALSALSNLGYNRLDAYNIIQKIIATNSNISLSELIKLSLKELSR